MKAVFTTLHTPSEQSRNASSLASVTARSRTVGPTSLVVPAAPNNTFRLG